MNNNRDYKEFLRLISWRYKTAKNAGDHEPGGGAIFMKWSIKVFG